jgi:hypothetical protein
VTRTVDGGSLGDGWKNSAEEEVAANCKRVEEGLENEKLDCRFMLRPKMLRVRFVTTSVDLVIE